MAKKYITAHEIDAPQGFVASPASAFISPMFAQADTQEIIGPKRANIEAVPSISMISVQGNLDTMWLLWIANGMEFFSSTRDEPLRSAPHLVNSVNTIFLVSSSQRKKPILNLF
jgi:hypothetical protein